MSRSSRQNSIDILVVFFNVISNCKIIWFNSYASRKTTINSLWKISLDDLCKESLELYIADVFKGCNKLKFWRKTR